MAEVTRGQLQPIDGGVSDQTGQLEAGLPEGRSSDVADWGNVGPGPALSSWFWCLNASSVSFLLVELFRLECVSVCV